MFIMNELDEVSVGHKSSIIQKMVAYKSRVEVALTFKSKTAARLIVNNLNVSKGSGTQLMYYMALIIITFNTFSSISSYTICFHVGNSCGPFNKESKNVITYRKQIFLKHIISLKT
jgi:hypothetical protein